MGKEKRRRGICGKERYVYIDFLSEKSRGGIVAGVAVRFDRIVTGKGTTPVDGVIAFANQEKKTIPSNREFTPLLFSGHLKGSENAKIESGKKDLKMPARIITGTVVGIEQFGHMKRGVWRREGKPFGKEIIFKPSSRITKHFIVPEEHRGKVNCALVATQGFDNGQERVPVKITVRKSGMIVTYDIPAKYITCVENVAPSYTIDDIMKGRTLFFPDEGTHIATTTLQGVDALMLTPTINRRMPFVGPVLRSNDTKKFDLPDGIIDYSPRSFEPVLVNLFDAENYAMIAKCAEKAHANLMKPVVILSDLSETTHLTLRYGIKERVRMEGQIKKISRCDKGAS